MIVPLLISKIISYYVFVGCSIAQALRPAIRPILNNPSYQKSMRVPLKIGAINKSYVISPYKIEVINHNSHKKFQLQIQFLSNHANHCFDVYSAQLQSFDTFCKNNKKLCYFGFGRKILTFK